MEKLRHDSVLPVTNLINPLRSGGQNPNSHNRLVAGSNPAEPSSPQPGRVGPTTVTCDHRQLGKYLAPRQTARRQS